MHISSQDLVSKSEIYTSTVKPEKSNGEALDMANTATPRSWSIKWSVIASCFGLSGIDAGQPGRGEVDLWWNEHQHDYRNMCKIFGLFPREMPPSLSVFFNPAFTLLDRGPELSPAKIR